MPKFSMTKLLITRKCNAKCPYCVVPTIKTKDAPVDDLMRAIPIIDRLSDFLAIQGGEPTLSPNLDAVIEYLAKHRASDSYVLVTNGITLKDVKYRQHLKSLGLESVSVSHDSFKTWNEQLIKDIVKEFKYVTVCTIYDRFMVGKFIPLLEYLTSLGVRIVANPIIWHHDDGFSRWFTGPRDQPNVIPMEMKDTVERDMKEVIARYDQFNLITGKGFLEQIPRYGLNMSWHCKKWTTLEVNNDLHIQFCQDLPTSKYTIFDVDAKFAEMEQAHREFTSVCSGCYNNCYTDLESGHADRR